MAISALPIRTKAGWIGELVWSTHDRAGCERRSVGWFALTHEHVRMLEVKPGSQWKTENMEREYEELADRHGTPRAVLVDGAPVSVQSLTPLPASSSVVQVFGEVRTAYNLP